MGNSAPVLLLAFNRPDKCARVFERLREARPEKLFFAVDGPRIDHAADVANCEATRNLVKLIDWECEVKTLFQAENKGCRKAPPEAISWFFDHVEAGIILEDDCVPSPDFFPFASELLERYADNPNIGMITGNNHYAFQKNKVHSYHFSQIASIWGWATWARAWKNYDIEMKPYLGGLEEIKASLGQTKRYRNFWWRLVTAVEEGLDAWSIQWIIALLAHKQLTIRPTVNLVGNIGFEPEATHTVYDCDFDLFEKTYSLSFPLKHPDMVVQDMQADLLFEHRFTSYWFRLLTLLGDIFGVHGQAVSNRLKQFDSIRRQLKSLT